MAEKKDSGRSQSAPRLQNIPVRTEQGREIRDALDVTVGPAELIVNYGDLERRISNAGFPHARRFSFQLPQARDLFPPMLRDGRLREWDDKPVTVLFVWQDTWGRLEVSDAAGLIYKLFVHDSHEAQLFYEHMSALEKAHTDRTHGHAQIEVALSEQDLDQIDRISRSPKITDAVVFKPDILDRALAVWLEHLTEDELVELSERLDDELGHPLLYKLDEHLAKVRPELFVDPNESVTKEV